MNLDHYQINAFALESSGAAARALCATCTLTLELPAGAQASSPGERPLGSVVRIEIDGQPVTRETVARPPLPASRAALLTLTF